MTEQILNLFAVLGTVFADDMHPRGLGGSGNRDRDLIACRSSLTEIERAWLPVKRALEELAGPPIGAGRG